jgi:hypothetical protein
MEKPQRGIGHLTVAEAAPILEAEFRRRLGNSEYEKLYRSLDLQLSEMTTEQETQLYGVIAMIGNAGNDRTLLFLSIIWLAKKEARDSLVREPLEITRQKTVRQLLLEARRAVQDQ